MEDKNYTFKGKRQMIRKTNSLGSLTKSLLFGLLFLFVSVSCAPNPEGIRVRYPRKLELVGGYFGDGASTHTWGGVQHFELSGSYVFLVTYERPYSNLIVLDTSNTPELAAVAIHPIDERLSDAVSDLFLNNERLYLSSESGLETFDVTNPENPSSFGWYAHQSDRDTRIIATGDYAYFFTVQNTNDSGKYQPLSANDLPDWYGIEPKWTVLDVSSPENPIVVKEIDGFAEPKTISGNYIYASSWWQPSKEDLGSKLQIIDISDKANPNLMADQYITFSVDDLVVVDEIAYVGNGTSIVLMDVSDPIKPEILDSFGPVGSFGTIDVDDSLLVGDYVWLVRLNFTGQSVKFEPVANIDEQELSRFICSREALLIFDSEAHQNSSCEESYIYGYNISPDVALQDGLIYVATESKGLMVFEIP